MLDLARYPYYKLNIIYMKLFGQWPDQSDGIRILVITTILFLGITHVTPQIMVVVNNYKNRDVLVECTMSLLFVGFVATKFIAAALNKRRRPLMMNRILSDWEVCARNCDVDILHEYAEKGRKVIVVYSVLGWSCYSFFAIQPAVPKIIDVLLKNGTELGRFPVPIDYYFFDMQKYYFCIILHFYMSASMGVVGAIAYDCWFIVYVQHSCGMFAALGRKLERVGKNGKYTGIGGGRNTLDKSDMDLDILGSCIERHHDAIEFAKFIEANYSWCYFVVMGFNMLTISITGLQIVTRLADGEQTMRFVIITLYAIFHLYVENYMAQILMDHSISIRDCIQRSEWYRLPAKTQKFLIPMMIRCNVPCKLTAGKIWTMSMENFGMVLKTSLSYFTILRSL